MERNYSYVSRKPVPLERAKSNERFAMYAITLVIGLVVVMVAKAIFIVNAMPPGHHAGFVNAVVTFAQLIVTLATLVLVGVQMRIAVRQLEQHEGSRNSAYDRMQPRIPCSSDRNVTDGFGDSSQESVI
jgi:hypothetical protein